MARFASCRNHALTHVPACLGQSFELARVLEGEKAQRGEVAKKLADLSRRLAHANAVGDGAAAAALGPERAALDLQLQRHSAHVSLLASRPCNTHPLPERAASFCAALWCVGVSSYVCQSRDR